MYVARMWQALACDQTFGSSCSGCSQSVSDRYFVALYKKLLDPALKTSAKQTMFLNLLFKSLRQDISEKRIKVSLSIPWKITLLQVLSTQLYISEASTRFICCNILLLKSNWLKFLITDILSHSVVEELFWFLFGGRHSSSDCCRCVPITPLHSSVPLSSFSRR